MIHRILIASLAAATPTAAFAHAGHLGELAGHAHWAGVAALAGAALVAGVIALKDRKRKQEEETPEAEVEDPDSAGEAAQ
jgi:hypothetical protein